MGQPTSQGPAMTSPSVDSSRRSRRPRSPWLRWSLSLLSCWQLWLIMATGLVGGTGTLAFMTLIRLPQSGDCPRMFWPLASASQRIYCAQAAAEQRTKRGLLDAIALVDPLANNHPLRPMVDRYIRKWALELIDVSEDLFEDGKLGEALDTVKRIPLERLACTNEDCPPKRIKRRTDRWKKIWGEAEKIYKEAEAAIIDQKLNLATEIAADLLSVDNRYWRTVKYEELSSQILEVRGNNIQLARARELAEKGGAENLIKAIELAASINSGSRVYPIAQGAIAKFSRQLLDEAEKYLEREDLNEALSIVDRIPARAKLGEDIKDFKILARAKAKTWSGHIPDIQAAIVEVQLIKPDRPLYGRSQDLVAEWQTAIQDIARLERARQVANSGRIPDLVSAIAEVSLMPRSNPRWQEAQELISTWQANVETQEDRPFLQRAEQLAQNGTLAGYQSALAEAGRIRRGRALYAEAQQRMDDWRSRAEWMEDQPYLAQARSLAMNGNLNDAIAMAQRIQPGRTLYGDAQAEVSTWQAQVDANSSLTRARNYAQDNANPDSLRRAIDLADQIPRNTGLRYTAESEIDSWSNQILELALNRAYSDLYQAIDIARLVPRGTSAYNAAQDNIRLWEQQLTPIAPPPEPEPLPDIPPEPPAPSL